MLAEPLFETKGVFARHYIDHWIRQNPDWPTGIQVEECFQRCRALFADKVPHIQTQNEQVCRDELLNKIIEALGFSYIPNVTEPGVAKGSPDYLLFADDAAKIAALDGEVGKQYAHAIAVLEAKRYGHNLGAVSKTETPGRFPHNQIRDYLQNAWDESSRRAYFNWGALTNGKEWRLYTRDAQTISYFSLNLEKAVREKADFKLFYFLFSTAAFVKNAEGRCRLDFLRAEALDHQTQLETSLRLRVYKLLEILANGIYKNPRNKVQDDDIPQVYEASLIILYRLLFVLYAEAKGVLPVKPHGYGLNRKYREEFSLTRLKPGFPRSVLPEKDFFDRQYRQIKELFTLISGQDDLAIRYTGLPRYDGGLFDPKNFPAVERWTVGDYTMWEVLKGLMFSPRPSQTGETLDVDFSESIDYSDLKVRQLGSIYEGLLEHHLEKADDGSLKLETDKTDRKSSGSYYTPDVVVQFIVEESLAPQLERIEALKPVKQRQPNAFAAEALKLRLLDPAMGSGHFLVRATEYLAEQIACHPTTILAVKDAPSGESHDDLELAYWRRRVVESSVFGVDKNPLAVELAKLSLWLTCVSVKRPLNFLDHHLRCGDSLVGAQVAELESLNGSAGGSDSLFKIQGLDAAIAKAVASLSIITDQESVDFAAVQAKKIAFREGVRQGLARFRAVADLRTALEFLGSGIDGLDKEALYRELALSILESEDAAPEETLQRKYGEVWASLRKLIDKEHFFHWELEFADAYAGEKPGFEVVMGNPPYGANFNPLMVDKLRERYGYEKGYLDFFILFMEKGLRLGISDSSFSLIVPSSWLGGVNYRRIRENMLRKNILRLVMLPHDMFAEADVNTMIFVVQNRFDEDYAARTFTFPPDKPIEHIMIKENQYNTIHQSWWIQNRDQKIALNEDHLRIINQMQQALGILGDVMEMKRGILLTKDVVYRQKLGESYLPLFIDGVSRYVVKREFSGYINFDDPAVQEKPKEDRWFRGERLLLRRVVGKGGRLYAARTEEDFILSKNFYLIKVKDDSLVSYHTMLGLINSKLLSFYNRAQICQITKKYFPQITIADIFGIPFPKVNENTTAKLTEIGEKALKLESLYLENYQKMFVRKDPLPFEKEIDSLVYQLYGIDDEGIKVVEAMYPKIVE